MQWIDRLLIASLLFGVGYLTGIVLSWREQPLNELYNSYTYVQLYEDGSYRAQLHNGTLETGCLKGALCER